MPLLTLLVIDFKSAGLELVGRIEQLLMEDPSLTLFETVPSDWTKIVERLSQYDPHIIWIHLQNSDQAGLDLIKKCTDYASRIVPPLSHVVASSFAPSEELVVSAFEQGAVDVCDLANERDLMITGLRWRSHLAAKNCPTCGSSVRADFLEQKAQEIHQQWEAETGGKWVV